MQTSPFWKVIVCHRNKMLCSQLNELQFMVSFQASNGGQYSSNCTLDQLAWSDWCSYKLKHTHSGQEDRRKRGVLDFPADIHRNRLKGRRVRKKKGTEHYNGSRGQSSSSDRTPCDQGGGRTKNARQQTSPKYQKKGKFWKHNWAQQDFYVTLLYACFEWLEWFSAEY